MQLLLLEEICGAVQRINEDIHKNPNLEETSVDFICNGEDCIVRFLDMELWDSAEDSRDFDENTDSYLPLEDHLRFRINAGLIHIKRMQL